VAIVVAVVVVVAVENVGVRCRCRRYSIVFVVVPGVLWLYSIGIAPFGTALLPVARVCCVLSTSVQLLAARRDACTFVVCLPEVCCPGNNIGYMEGWRGAIPTIPLTGVIGLSSFSFKWN